jgi:DNA-binding PadR family transcriptional regulator
MSVPELSHLQIAVLNALGPKELSGRELREALKTAKISKSGPAFYQIMARLEDAKFVNGRYEEKVVEGQRIRERRYNLTGEGANALRNAVSFYTPIFARHGLA